MTEALLASKTKTNLLAFFLENRSRYYGVEELRQQAGGRNLSEDLAFLARHNFLMQLTKRGQRYYALDPQNTELPSVKGGRKFPDPLAKAMRKLNGFRLGIFTGLLTGYPKLECDVVLIGDFSDRSLASFERTAGALLGQDINYAVLSQSEYDFRKDTFDRFIKDVFENDHVLIQRERK